MSYLRQVDPVHKCSLPLAFGKQSDWTWEGEGYNKRPKLLPGRRLPHVGDVWQCDSCGLTWVFDKVLPRGGYSSPAWRRERELERKFREWRKR